MARAWIKVWCSWRALLRDAKLRCPEDWRASLAKRCVLGSVRGWRKWLENPSLVSAIRIYPPLLKPLIPQHSARQDHTRNRHVQVQALQDTWSTLSRACSLWDSCPRDECPVAYLPHEWHCVSHTWARKVQMHILLKVGILGIKGSPWKIVSWDI